MTRITCYHHIAERQNHDEAHGKDQKKQKLVCTKRYEVKLKGKIMLSAENEHQKKQV